MCSFLSEEPIVNLSSKNFKNIATEQQFEYNAYFDKMIEDKKTDHSYRVFRKVNRNACAFPLADDYTFSEEPSKVAVWCSNDYLGMSGHPAVVTAAK